MQLPFLQDIPCALDKYGRSYEWGLYGAQKPRRESASQVDEFFESGTTIVNPFDTTSVKPYTNPNSAMEQASYHHHPYHHHYNNYNSNNMYNNNSSSRKNRPCRLDSQQEDLFTKTPSQDLFTKSMNFPDLMVGGESPDLPGLFESITPPYHPNVCVKNEKIPQQQDPCAYPPSSPEFASLLDVSQPEQVIVKREPTLLDTKQQCQQYNPSVSQQQPYMGHFAMSRLHMMPLTPPSSEPGSDSVDSSMATGTIRTTPPPPYLCTGSPNVMSNNGGVSVKGDEEFGKTPYSRRNNPELEKRRTHRCIFPGEQ